MLAMAAIFRHISNYSENNNVFSFYIENNVFKNNLVGSNIDLTNDIVCQDISGLSGFDAAMWIDLKEEFTIWESNNLNLFFKIMAHLLMIYILIYIISQV